jgi:hypothetical protein
VWSTANTLAAGTIVQPAANVLTLLNSAASTLSLAITATKTLTFTVANDLILTLTGGATTLGFGATGRTYTFSDVAGTVSLGAGTLTVSTANDVTVAAHLHAITSVSSSTAAANLLACNASGYLQLIRLGLGAAPLGLLHIAGIGYGDTNTLKLVAVSDPLRIVGGLYGTREMGCTINQYFSGDWTRDTQANSGAVFVIRNSATAGQYGSINFYSSAANSALTTAPTLLLSTDTAGGLVVAYGFGCNGKAAQTAYSLGAASTDLATVIALANKLRLMAIANGSGST